jgi:hypothetical protein
MDSPLEWTMSLSVPFGGVIILGGIVTQRVVRYVFVKRETIGGVAVQGKEVYNTVSEHGPIFWRKIKHYFIEMKGGKAYTLCTSNNLLEPDFIGVFSTVSALQGLVNLSLYLFLFVLFSPELLPLLAAVFSAIPFSNQCTCILIISRDEQSSSDYSGPDSS